MQQIYKIIFLFFHEDFFYKIIKILINIILIITFISLSSCSLLIDKKTSFLNQKILKQKKEFGRLKKNKECLKNYTIYKNVISYGDSISFLLKKSGVKINDILKLIKIDKNLNNIKIGQKIDWKVNKFGNLVKLKWCISDFQKKIYKNIKMNLNISDMYLILF